MKKPNKRQIIILAIMAIAILYAAYDLFVAQPAAKKAKMEAAKPAEVEIFVSEANDDALKNKLAAADAYIISKAEAQWEKNPFWERAEYREFAGSESAGGLAGKIIYSGFIDAGRKSMAIINGFEYGPGDALELEGYVLRSITPSRILIVNSNTGSELFIPIQE